MSLKVIDRYLTVLYRFQFLDRRPNFYYVCIHVYGAGTKLYTCISHLLHNLFFIHGCFYCLGLKNSDREKKTVKQSLIYSNKFYRLKAQYTDIRKRQSQIIDRNFEKLLAIPVLSCGIGHVLVANRCCIQNSISINREPAKMV